MILNLCNLNERIILVIILLICYIKHEGEEIMKNVVLLRKEAFGGTLFNSTTGKRIYINKQEYKELLTNNDLIYEFDIIDNKKNTKKLN